MRPNPTSAARPRLQLWLPLMLVFISAARVHAQPAPPAPAPESTPAELSKPTPSPEQPGPAIPIAGPDTTIWVDDQGVPRPVVGIDYERLLRSWKAMQRLEAGEQRPRLIRERLEITGRIERGRVRFTARFEIALPSGGRVETPLGLAGAVLVGDPTITSAADASQPESDQYVSFSSERGGFVAWLEGQPGDRRVVELPLAAALVVDRNQATLRLNLPRSARSEIRLDSPDELFEPFASGGAEVEIVGSADGGSRLVARGAVGDLQLGWRRPEPAPATSGAVVLGAKGAILCRVDGQGVQSRATLNVESYGGPLERFRVRLPAGATLIPSGRTQRPGSPTVALLPPAAGEAAADAVAAERPVCMVTMPERTSGPVQVTLLVSQPFGADAERGVEVGAFEVVGAARQSGEMALAIEEDWRLRLGEVAGGRRVDPASVAPELREEGVVAAAEYFAQPFVWRVRAERLQARVEAKPRYRLAIGDDAAQLTMTVDYRVPGARVTGFTIDMDDWAEGLVSQSAPGSGDVIDTSGLDNTDGQLYLPLLRPASQQLRIEVVARRELPPGNKPVVFRLPVPRATTHAAAELIVVAEGAVELTPDAARSRNLIATAIPPSERDEADPSGIRTLRFTSTSRELVFAATKRLRPGELDAEFTTEAVVGNDETRVRQRLDFDIRFAPVTSVRVAAPTELVEATALEFRLLPPKDAEASAGGDPGVPLQYTPIGPLAADDSRQAVAVALPSPWIGPCRIEARYTTEGGLLDLEKTGGAQVPLLTAVGLPLLAHSAKVSAADGRPLSLPESRNGWQATPAEGALLAATTASAESLPIAFRRAEPRAGGEAILRRAWWHTWAADGQTQQRAVFAFNTSADEVTITLPVSDGDAPIELLLDGQLVDGRRVAAGEQAITLAGGGPNHVLEVRYFEPSQPGAGALPWRPVRLVANGDTAICYWLVTPAAGRVTIGSPEGFSKSAGDQRWLAAMPGRDSLAPAKAGAEGVLFTRLGPPPPDAALAVAVVSRRMLSIAVSALVAVVGLAVVYVPVLRRPPGVLLLVAAALALGWWRPGELGLVVTAGLAGVVAAVVAGLVAAVLRPSPGSDFSFRGSTLAGALSGPGTDTMIALPMGTVSTNAPTASMPPTDSHG